MATEEPITPLAREPSLEPRIVVGVDGSEDSKEALRWAAREAKSRGGTVCAVIAWQVPPMALIGAYVPPDLHDNSMKAAEAALNEAIASVADDLSGVALIRQVVEGPPIVVLGNESEGADLLVVGTRGHGTISSIILGSVSKHMSAHSPCPVVVVRAKRSRFGRLGQIPPSQG